MERHGWSIFIVIEVEKAMPIRIYTCNLYTNRDCKIFSDCNKTTLTSCPGISQIRPIQCLMIFTTFLESLRIEKQCDKNKYITHLDKDRTISAVECGNFFSMTNRVWKWIVCCVRGSVTHIRCNSFCNLSYISSVKPRPKAQKIPNRAFVAH